MGVVQEDVGEVEATLSQEETMDLTLAVNSMIPGQATTTMEVGVDHLPVVVVEVGVAMDAGERRKETQQRNLSININNERHPYIYFILKILTPHNKFL